MGRPLSGSSPTVTGAGKTGKFLELAYHDLVSIWQADTKTSCVPEGAFLGCSAHSGGRVEPGRCDENSSV